MDCDFCGVHVECEEGSAFNDGTLYSNVGYDDRVACKDCCGNIKFKETEDNVQSQRSKTKSRGDRVPSY